MFSLRVSLLVACAVLIAAAGVQERPQQGPEIAREAAYRANNIGVAFLEQYDYDRAAASFRDALARRPDLHTARVNLAIALFYAGQDEEALGTVRTALERLPELPHAHYVLGLAARSQGRTEEATAAFRRVLELDPGDPGSRINLGQMLLQQRQYEDAVRLFREALAAEPFNVTAAYGLATAVTRSAGTAAGRDDMQRFETLRDSAYGVTYAQRYLEQGRYGEAIVSTGAEPELVDPAAPAVSFLDSTVAVFGAAARPAGDAMPGSATPGGSVNLFDVDDDGDLDLFATSTTGGGLQRFFVNSGGSFAEATAKARLERGDGPAGAGALAGDYDNDLRPDLLLLRPDGLRLLHQRDDRGYEDVTARAGLPLESAFPRSASFADTDHDGDLDIVAAYGRVGAQGAARSPQLLRNNGNGTFTDITAASGLGEAAADIVGIAATDFDNRRDIDILMVGPDAVPRLFQNMRDGTFRDVAGTIGLPAAAPYSALAAGDVNKDGFVDFYFARQDGPGVMAYSDGRGRFGTAAAPEAAAAIAQFIDYDNDGLLDLFTVHRRSIRLFRNIGGKWADASRQSGLAPLAEALNADVVSVAFGDLDRDGDLDGAVLLANGELRSWRNDGGNRNRSLRVKLEGRVSNRAGIGSKVDIRAGSLRQRLEAAAATPAFGPADLLFGLGSRPSADVVRVIWPSGTLQAEATTDARDITIEELDRKPSSCPYLYTWNGSRFEFVTDFMGGGEIGYWQAPGVWNTPDPDEYVRIRPDQLVARGGRYELRVTNELEEALFVDRLQLVAVDHAADVGLFPNEGLGAPASAAFLTAVRSARPAASATDEHGHDVLDRLARIDRAYPDDFAPLDIRGYAAPHELRIDIGPAPADPVLLATGWTDYAFSGDNVAAHQRGLRLIPPSLDVRTASGSWRRVLPAIGIPVGRPQTIVVDLRGKLRPGEHLLRITTNMRIYWDQVLVGRSGAEPPSVVHRLEPTVAALRWRGFSAEMSPDGRQPFTYDYHRVSHLSPWKTMTGSYTREGDVRELLTKTDDMFVIARPGDEIALSFDAAALPALAPGAIRTYLLYADGFSKEMDINSATPYSVEPLPFHAMRGYPYGADQRYPSTPAHLDYRARYNTRTISKPLPPLEIGSESRKR